MADETEKDVAVLKSKMTAIEHAMTAIWQTRDTVLRMEEKHDGLSSAFNEHIADEKETQRELARVLAALPKYDDHEARIRSLEKSRWYAAGWAAGAVAIALALQSYAKSIGLI